MFFSPCLLHNVVERTVTDNTSYNTALVVPLSLNANTNEYTGKLASNDSMQIVVCDDINIFRYI